MKRPAVPLFLSLCLFGSLGLAQPLLEQFKRATTALEGSVARFPGDQVGSLDALRTAETAFGALGAELEPRLRQGLEATFSRAEQALVNGSETDLAVQAAVLRGGFRRSVYEAALEAAADGQTGRAQTLLEAVGRDLGLSEPRVTGSDRQALQTAFEVRLAALSLGRLDTPGDDLESRYRTLAELYSHVFLVQDSPRLPPETRSGVLNTIRALVEGRPVDDGFALLRGQLERFLRSAEAAGGGDVAVPGGDAGTAATTQAQSDRTQSEPQPAQDAPTATPAGVPAGTPATPPVAPLPTVAAPADPAPAPTDAPTDTALEAFPSVLGTPLPTLLRLAAGLLALVGLVQLLTTLPRNPAPRQGAALALLLVPAVAEGFAALAALLAALPFFAGLPSPQAHSSLFTNPTAQLVWAGLVAAAVLCLAGGQGAATAPKGARTKPKKAASATPASDGAAPLPPLTPAPSRAAASTLRWDDDF